MVVFGGLGFGVGWDGFSDKGINYVSLSKWLGVDLEYSGVLFMW